MRFLPPALAALCLLAALPAAAFRAQNGMIVDRVDPATFAVRWSGRSGAPGFWCAAGDYAMHVLNAPGNVRIYRYDAPGRRQGEGITFGLDPARAQSPGLGRLQGGDGVLAVHARQFCFTSAGGRD